MRRIFFLLVFVLGFFSFNLINAQDPIPPPPVMHPIQQVQVAEGMLITVHSAAVYRDLIEVKYSITPQLGAGIQVPKSVRMTLYDAGRVGQGLLPPNDTELGSWLGIQVVDPSLHPDEELIAFFPLVYSTLLATVPARHYIPVNQPMPESLDLVLKFDYVLPQPAAPAPEVTAEVQAPDDTSTTVSSAQNPATRNTELLAVFEFTVPAIPPQVVDVQQTVSINGITSLTLERILIDGMTMSFEMCAPVNETWYVETALIGLELGNQLYQAYDGTGNECSRVTSGIIPGYPPANVGVNVVSVARGAGMIDTLEEWRAIEPLLNRDGIYLNLIVDENLPGGFRMGGYRDANGTSIPDLVPPGAAPTVLQDYAVEAGILERVRGNWEFTAIITSGSPGLYADLIPSWQIADDYTVQPVISDFIIRATEQAQP